MQICIYGASSSAIESVYIEKTEELGRMLAKRGHGLVFGGGAHGLMGAAARGFHEENGIITGIAPRFFDVDGILYEHCTSFIYTETMRERKQNMEDRSDAFIVTPGGIGTFEEFFEILTLKQLGRHAKPIAVFNINGYYDSLQEMMRKSADSHFMRQQTMELYRVFDDAQTMIAYLENDKSEAVDMLKMKY